MTVSEEVSREDFDSAVRAVSDVVSGFCPGSSLHTAERTYRAWKSELNLICEVNAYPGGRLLWRGVVPEPAGWRIPGVLLDVADLDDLVFRLEVLT